MHTRFLRIFVLIVLATSLAGCWNATRQYNKFMALGQQRNVPLLILNTSWNNAAPPNLRRPETSLDAALLNTGHRSIDSVDLYVTYCPYGSAQSRHRRLVPYAGPILPGETYLGRYAPSLSPGFAEYSHTHPHFVMTYPAAVIRSIAVTYADGRQIVYKKNVAQLLAPSLSNYCPVGANAVGN